MKVKAFIEFVLGSFFVSSISLGDSTSKGAYNVKSCFGIEPLWNLEIYRTSLAMEGPYDDEKISVAHRGVVTAVGYPARA
jgi:hypothetical protein